MSQSASQAGPELLRGANDRTGSVLVVDDEPDVVSLVSAYISRLEEDIAVYTETDPEAALARYRELQVDCIVCDYEMPNMDGLSFLSAVRERDPETPFVLFTGVEAEDVVDQARNWGATYVHKSGRGGGFEDVTERVADRLGSSGS